MQADREHNLRGLSDAVLTPFLEVRDLASPDLVVADPELNARFITACRARDITASDLDINRALLNLRKRGGLSSYKSRRTRIPHHGEYEFASEIAARSLERKHRTTLDRIICDPRLAEEFDRIASAICPGFQPVQYRWAALRLRKTNRLRPEILGRVVPTQVVSPVPVAAIDILLVPNEQGLYIFTNREKVLYVGEAQNLRARLRKHLDHSDNKFLARYIWEFGMDDVLLEYHVLPHDTRTDVRKAMELELIRSRRAELNVQR